MSALEKLISNKLIYGRTKERSTPAICCPTELLQQHAGPPCTRRGLMSAWAAEKVLVLSPRRGRHLVFGDKVTASSEPGPLPRIQRNEHVVRTGKQPARTWRPGTSWKRLPKSISPRTTRSSPQPSPRALSNKTAQAAWHQALPIALHMRHHQYHHQHQEHVQPAPEQGIATRAEHNRPAPRKVSVANLAERSDAMMMEAAAAGSVPQGGNSPTPEESRQTVVKRRISMEQGIAVSLTAMLDSIVPPMHVAEEVDLGVQISEESRMRRLEGSAGLLRVRKAVEKNMLRLQKLVSDHDTDGVETSTKGEFLRMIKMLFGKEFAVEDVSDFFDVFDADGSGAISFREMRRVAATRCSDGLARRRGRGWAHASASFSFLRGRAASTL